MLIDGDNYQCRRVPCQVFVMKYAEFLNVSIEISSYGNFVGPMDMLKADIVGYIRLRLKVSIYV